MLSWCQRKESSFLGKSQVWRGQVGKSSPPGAPVRNIKAVSKRLTQTPHKSMRTQPLIRFPHGEDLGKALTKWGKNGINRLVVQSVNPCTGYSATGTGLLGAVSTWRPAAFYVSSSHFKPNCRKMQEGIKWIPFRAGAVKNRATDHWLRWIKKGLFPQILPQPTGVCIGLVSRKHLSRGISPKRWNPPNKRELSIYHDKKTSITIPPIPTSKQRTPPSRVLKRYKSDGSLLA